MTGAVLELFQEGKISAGKAAEVLGLSKAQFIELLNDRNLPYLDADLKELEREVAAAEAASRRFRR
jgi:predicted HTH domain antitoxin